MIAENMLSKVDSDGVTMQLLESIIDYKQDDATAIPKPDKYIYNKQGQ